MTRITEDDLARLLNDNPEVRLDKEASAPPAWEAPVSPALQPLAPVPLESAEQKLVIVWAEVAVKQYPALDLLIHVPNGGRRLGKEGAYLKAEGVRAGVPDLLLLCPAGGWTGCAIELKRADHSNGMTPEQEAWMLRLQRAGWWTKVCYGAAEAIAALSAYCNQETGLVIEEGAKDEPN